MNLLILVPEIRPCGPINVVLSLVESNFFKKSKMCVWVVEIRASDETEYKKNFKNVIGDNVISLSGVNLKSYFNFQKILRENAIDVVHSHGFYPDSFLAFSSIKGLLKVSTSHNIIHEDYFFTFGRKGSFFSHFHYFLLRNFFDKVVGCSNRVYQNLINNNLGTESTLRIYNGININKFLKISKFEKKRRRVELNLLDNQIVYIYSGSLWPMKKVPELIDIFKEKLQIDPNSFLLILGDGPDEKLCKQKIEGEDNIKMVGKVPNPEFYLQLADIALSNSSSEGFPLAILEAISCGCFVYLSDIEPHREIMSLFPYSTAPIKNILESGMKFLEINGAQVDLISDEKMAEQYFNVYNYKRNK